MAELKKLIEQRGHIKARLTRFKNFVNSITDNPLEVDSDLIATVTERVNNNSGILLNEYIEIYTKIISVENIPIHDDDMATFEDNYYIAIGKINNFLSKHAKAPEITPAEVKIANSSLDLGSLRLPPINLPTFSGKFEDWDEFHDTFDCLINKNSQLSIIQKFHYLISAVEGDAAQALRCLKITTANYTTAWDILKKRFENKKLIVQNNLKAFFDLDYIKRDSHQKLQQFLDNILKIMQALKTHEQPTVDLFMIYIASIKLSPATRHEWELYKSNGEFPTFNEFLEFLERKCKILASLEVNTTLFGNNTAKNFKENESISYVSTGRQFPSCAFCKNNHAIYNCEAFLMLNVNSRIAKARELRLCMNCLKKNHTTRVCTSQPCQKCNKKHNSILHLEYEKHPNQAVTVTRVTNQVNRAESSSHSSETNQNNDIVILDKNLNNPPVVGSLVNHSSGCANRSQILLSTACVQVTDVYGNTHICRCLLDPGSQSNIITNDLCNRLGLPKEKYNLTITGISQLSSRVNYKTTVAIKSRINNYKADMTCLILDNITDHLPVISFNLTDLNIPQNIELADPKCNVSKRIDLLIGANIFWELLCNGQHKLGKNLPILQKTQLGWILGGTFTQNNCKNSDNNTLVHLSTTLLHDQLEKFWTLEECRSDSYSKYSTEEKYCEDHFVSTHKRANAFPHRFIVNMPLKDNASKLGDSKQVALKRFYSLERKLNRDDKLKTEYANFLKEYANLGHMTKIIDENTSKQPTYYLPHHAVVKESSSTSKVRVVFDASAKPGVGVGLSLNEVQCVGPVIQDDLFSILIRFRQHEYVLSADIAKMYRQILVDDKQRSLQLILWRFNANQPVSSYQLNTVTYGMASSSFVATRCLKQLALEYRDKYPMSSRVIEKDFYVDDLLSGFDSREKAIQARDEISEILASAGFELRKWASNDETILENINIGSGLDQGIIPISDNIGTLGIKWNPSADNLQYSARDVNLKQITKRTILSSIAQIFDPLGLLGPIIVTAKLLIQKLWQSNLSWDEAVPLDLHTKFQNFRQQLPIINNLKIRRHVICKQPIIIELHGFCDASESAYGACIYIRSIDNLGVCHVRLLSAKSRVAPLKNISLPRLELCGALLLAHLAIKVKESLNIEFNDEYYWCDSTISISWIKSAPNRWKTFVANRVAEIQRLTKIENWRHVNTNENPADLVSRGLEPSQLENANLWWNGPEFLLNRTFESSPMQQIQCDNDLPEARTVINLCTRLNNSDLFQRYSSLCTLQRVIAYCFRFVNNAKAKSSNRTYGPLLTKELQKSLYRLIKLAQGEVFFGEISNLVVGREINVKSSLLSLNPLIDNQGILRVGGRIQQSDFPYSKKHPIILPAGHILTALIIRSEHIRLLHAGTNLLLASLREKYWPISGKNSIKKIIRECIPCFKAKPKTIDFLMGSLPKTRLMPAPPFYNCGVDYAGPIFIRNKPGRGCKLIKAFICIFVCFVTKAIHIELANDLSTDEFLSALRRFISRRGLPSNIYSDNGTNFVGATSELKELNTFLANSENQNKIIDSLSRDNVSWHFIPARSPHFGGLWEAGVKSIKFHLRRIMGNAHLTFSQLYTLLTQIEAILNSRPLSPLSLDPNDMDPLTPSHFLIGRPIAFIPEPSLLDVADNRLNNYQHIQKLMQHFWRRWSVEYVCELQNRNKWKLKNQSSLHIGALVILQDDNLPPLKWKIARITDVHPGPDGVIRVVSVKTVSGNVTKRSVAKICVLPTHDEAC